MKWAAYKGLQKRAFACFSFEFELRVKSLSVPDIYPYSFYRNMKLNNTTVGVQNSSGPTEELRLPTLEPAFVYTVGIIYILIGVIATVGNVMVIFVILANKSLGVNPTNLFLLSLAISDLITSTLAMPFHIEFVFVQGIWKHGVFLCFAHLTAWLITVPTSILTLLAISIDRFVSLKDPLRSLNKQPQKPQVRDQG